MLDKGIMELFKIVESESADQREEAVLQIAMLLERTSRPLYAGNKVDIGFYQNILKPNLISIELNSERQLELIFEIRKLIMSNKMTPSLFWAIGKAKPQLGLAPLLDIMGELWSKIDENALQQALVAIDNFMIVDDAGRLQNWVAREVDEKSVMLWLKQLQKHKNVDVAQRAEIILLRITGHKGP